LKHDIATEPQEWKRMEWKLEIKDSGFVPQNRKPTEGNA